MNLQSVLKSLGDVDGEFPEEAMAWALEHWDTTRGALTQVLARCAKQLDEAPDADYAIALYAIHMLAEKREKQIFPLICALAKSPDGLAEVLGESAMWTGSAILISLFDGDAKALRDMATPDAPDQILAACALEAMAYLTMTGEIAREETVEHFTRVLALKNDDPMHIAVWDSWARGVAMLAIDELMPRLREALAVEGEGAGEIDTSDLDVLFRLAKEDPPGVFARENIAPLDDAIQALLRFELEMAEAMEEEGGLYGDGDDRDAPAAPAENPFRGVGRNDPCPCGSGKKFKKCCLAA